MKKLNLAIIGQGRSGRNIHGEYYKSETNLYYTVVAVVDQDSERRKRALEEYPGCQTYQSYTALFGRKDIDIVVNATFSEQHYSITKDLLLHGFNVLVEKPFAANYYQCLELIKLAKDNHVVLSVFQQSLLAPHHIGAKEAIDSGELGDIKQISIRYNGFARRWDWQTLQKKLAGSVYNTGPHPIGMALDYLGFDENASVVYSRIDTALTSGDAEDYAKILITAPNKPLVDIEISAIDAYCPYSIKIQGSRGTYLSTQSSYKIKYIVDGENPPRPVIEEPLKSPEGLPVYCSEKLVTHEEEGKFIGTAFNIAVSDFYELLYTQLTTGQQMWITPKMIAKVVNIIEKIHADSPLEVKF